MFDNNEQLRGRWNMKGESNLPGSYSPTPTTDRLPASGVGEAVTCDIIRHCSFTTGTKK